MFKSSPGHTPCGRELPRHEMKLTGIDSSDGETWACSVCGRRVILQSPPQFEQLTLERGEEYVLTWSHTRGVTVCTKRILEIGDAHAIHHGTRVVPTAGIPPRTHANETASAEDSSLLTIGNLPVGDVEPEAEDEAPLSDEWRILLSEAGFEQWWTQDLLPPEEL